MARRILWTLLVFWEFIPIHPNACAVDIETLFASPPSSASPWVFWYWMNGNVTREGVTADLESMKELGLGGAYLMPIKGPTESPLIDPPLVQLTPAWWEMVRYAMSEADRVGLQIAMHACDGFAVAGGPWITPELSMQKVVWSMFQIEGGEVNTFELPQPTVNEGYYRDIAILAIPSYQSSQPTSPKVTTSLRDFDAQFLASDQDALRLRMDQPGWILFTFEEPYLCRSITVTPDGNNFQANRLLVQASDDGKTFYKVGRLEPPRHGWQNGTSQITHAIKPTSARFFRFVFDKEGTEPGSEDLDSAKWSPILKVKNIELSSEPRIHQFRGKTGEVWHVSRRTSSSEIDDKSCVSLSSIIDLTDALDDQGKLNWEVPSGSWKILRLGRTSTGTRNETGGGGKGLECDKLNPRAVRLQFDSWFGEAVRQVGPELASRVLKIFHVDSWECGSQNWTPGFEDEFLKRRGYDPLLYLPAMAGIPVENADISERFLYDLRLTINELLVEHFFDTMADLAHESGCQFSAECVAPTMLGDGMRHFAEVDIPMGEFWLRSPTHDKPNDMLDAISAAHVYNKQIVQAEAFTELRMNWNEHPAMLKPLGDRQYCMGINRLVYHVFTHNPWLDRRPGMTLDNIGLYFQRDQTWWKPAKAWVDYSRRCQALLQVGKPVVDIAVFTGEEIPRRAVLPERLVNTLPGIIGKAAVEHEKERRENRDVPLHELPPGVKHSANMTKPDDWIDPLHGYSYDSLNHDALMQLATVRKGKIRFPGGNSYGLLVLPSSRPMSPNSELMTPQLATRLNDLVNAGATIVMCDPPSQSPSLVGYPDCDPKLRKLIHQILLSDQGSEQKNRQGRVVLGPVHTATFSGLGIDPDFVVTKQSGLRASKIAWVHRQAKTLDIYFVSNQASSEQELRASFRVHGRTPEIWEPVSGKHFMAKTWHTNRNRTVVPLKLAPHESLFVVFRHETERRSCSIGPNWVELQPELKLDGPWEVAFNPKFGGPNKPLVFDRLVDWTTRPEEDVRYYSGTSSYRQSFEWNPQSPNQTRYWLELGKVADLASVKLNDRNCGTAWTAPYRVEITSALKPGTNNLEIDVTNTWANRLLGDQRHPDAIQRSWTSAPPLPEDTQLREAGLLGPVLVASQIINQYSEAAARNAN